MEDFNHHDICLRTARGISTKEISGLDWWQLLNAGDDVLCWTDCKQGRKNWLWIRRLKAAPAAEKEWDSGVWDALKESKIRTSEEQLLAYSRICSEGFHEMTGIPKGQRSSGEVGWPSRTVFSKHRGTIQTSVHSWEGLAKDEQS